MRRCKPASRRCSISPSRFRHQDHRRRGPKVYSLHAPEVECIGKGKARMPYEFGCKVSLTTPVTEPKGGQFVLHAKALHGNPFDGHTLGPVVARRLWRRDGSPRITACDRSLSYLGIAFVGLGLLSSVFAVRDTSGHVEAETALKPEAQARSAAEVFRLTTWRDRNLSSVTQAGLVNNLNDGMAWGLFPLVFAAAGMNLGQIGILAAIYPAVWGMAQLGTGALSDTVGRKWSLSSACSCRL